MAETVPPKKRTRTRRNYQKELERLETYVRVTMEAIAAYVPEGESKQGQLTALKAVLGRMTENGKGNA